MISFINIGLGPSARKFILQSVGRGARIEPIPGRRKRLTARDGTHAANNEVAALETLFIFGANRRALHAVIDQLRRETAISPTQDEAAQNDAPSTRHRDGAASGPSRNRVADHRLEIGRDDLALLRRYMDYLDDDRLLAVHHQADARGIRLLHACLREPEHHFRIIDGSRYGRPEILIPRLLAYVISQSEHPKEG